MVVFRYLQRCRVKDMIINFLHVSSEGRVRNWVYQLEGGRFGLILKKNLTDNLVVWKSN